MCVCVCVCVSVCVCRCVCLAHLEFLHNFRRAIDKPTNITIVIPKSSCSKKIILTYLLMMLMTLNNNIRYIHISESLISLEVA